jgi:4-amino-4-deoxy-L-arabinose transferase-like glycosyltransferase
MNSGSSSIHKISNRLTSPAVYHTLFGVLLIAAFLLRFINLDADPPFLINLDFVPDEGGWAHNARNKFLWDHWFVSDHDEPFLFAPGYSYLIFYAFKLLGASLYSARFISAIAGSLTILVLWAYVAKEESGKITKLCVLFLALSSIHIIYSRLAMVEVLLTLFFILSLFLWAWRKRNAMMPFLSGALFVLMFSIKITAFYFIPTFVIFSAVEYFHKKIAWKEIGTFLIGAIISAVLIFGVLISEYFDEIIKHEGSMFSIVHQGLSVKYVSDIFLLNMSVNNNNISLFSNNFFLLCPIISLFSLLYMLKFMLMLNANWREAIGRLKTIEVLGIAMILGNLILIALSSNRPERRYIPMLIGMVVISAIEISSSEETPFYSNNYSERKGLRVFIEQILTLVPVYILICWTCYKLFGDWNFLNLGRDKGVSFHGQAILLFPVFIICLLIMSKFKVGQIDSEKKVAILLGMVSGILSAGWVDVIFEYFDIQQKKMGVVLVWAFTLLWSFAWGRLLVDNGSITKAKKAAPILFVVVQSIIIFGVIYKPTFSMREFGTDIKKEINGTPIVSQITSPMMYLENNVFYGYPIDETFLKRDSRHFVVTAISGENGDQDERYLTFPRYEKIDESAALVKSYSLFPFGMPERNRLKLYLWKIDGRSSE